MPHKTFATKNLQEMEPISFEIGDQTFECRKALPANVLLRMAHSMKGVDDETAQGFEMLEFSVDFFRSTMKKESFERFQALIDAEDSPIDMDLLQEIIAWLMEAYTERPTQQPKDSSSGQPSTGPSSEDGALQPA